jgi:hypothetical protein
MCSRRGQIVSHDANERHPDLNLADTPVGVVLTSGLERRLEVRRSSIEVVLPEGESTGALMKLRSLAVVDRHLDRGLKLLARFVITATALEGRCHGSGGLGRTGASQRSHASHELADLLDLSDGGLLHDQPAKSSRETERRLGFEARAE